MLFGCLFATIPASSYCPSTQPASLILLPASNPEEFVNSSQGYYVNLIKEEVGNHVKLYKNHPKYYYLL